MGKSDPNVAMSWVATTDSSTFNVYRGTSKGVWPAALLSGLVATTAALADVAAPPSLYY